MTTASAAVLVGNAAELTFASPGASVNGATRLGRPADLEHALAIADDLSISREAAARRYVALHDERLAVVFSAEGRVRYVEKGNGFPPTSVWTNDAVPIPASHSQSGSELTTLDEVSAVGWLSRPDDVTLFAQTLYQAEGYAMTLLLAEHDGDSEQKEGDRAPWDQ